jgi:hypothetical protein
MPVIIDSAARNAAVDAITARIDSGSGPGVLRIYSGSQPAGPGSAPTGTLLAEFTLSDPSFAAASGGSAALDVTPAVNDPLANNSGTAGWARFLTSTEAAGTGLGVMDGGVGTSGQMINLDSTTITSGQPVTINSGSITMPAS